MIESTISAKSSGSDSAISSEVVVAADRLVASCSAASVGAGGEFKTKLFKCLYSCIKHNKFDLRQEFSESIMEIFCSNDDTVDKSGFKSLVQQSCFLFALRVVEFVVVGTFLMVVVVVAVVSGVEDDFLIHFFLALISFNFLPGFGLGGSTHSFEVFIVTGCSCVCDITSVE